MNQTKKNLAERILEELDKIGELNQKQMWTIQTSDRGRAVVIILEVGKDYIKVRDADKREFFISLNGGLDQIRNVSADPAFKHPDA
jgi:hypothetical protein